MHYTHLTFSLNSLCFSVLVCKIGLITKMRMMMMMISQKVVTMIKSVNECREL